MNNLMNETKMASFLKWVKERKRFLVGLGAVFGVIFVVMLTQMRVLEITSRSVPYKSCLQFYHIKPKVGDLCVVEYKTQDGKTQTLVKYLAGTSGEIVTMWKGDIFVNHKRYVGKPNNRRLMPICLEGEEVKIPEGYVFVAGTHEDSLDSRYKEFGFVKISDIKGKATPLGKNMEQLSNFQNCNEPRFIHTSAIVEQNVDEELEAKEQKNKQEDEEFEAFLGRKVAERYRQDKQKQEKLMSRAEIANYDWAKWREEWMQKRKEENDKIIEKMLYKIANSGVDDEVTRSAKAFIRKQEEIKKLKNQKMKKKVKHTTKHTQSSNLTVERNAIDDFVKIALKRNPSWTLNEAKEFFFTASPNDPEYKKIMQELQRQQ